MRELGPRALGAYAALRSQIVAGDWPPGTRLPSQTALAAHLEVAPLTLRQALARLESEGMITRESRRGTFVQRTSAVAVPGLTDLFDVLFRHAPVGVCVVDSTGCLIKSNPALQDLLGYSALELEGSFIRDYTYPGDVARQAEVISRAIQEHRRYYELDKRYTRKDGTVIKCRLVVFSMILGGEDVGAVSIAERLADDSTEP